MQEKPAVHQTGSNCTKCTVLTCLKKGLRLNNARVKPRSKNWAGNRSPLETGLALHHTYGVPYIPGSALKGLASHYCDQVWGEKNPDYKLKARYHRVLFGTTDESGYIVFNDGWISPESLDSCLECDVMTIHHPKYYRSEDSPPSDYDSPTPITFLSINDKCTFQLFLYCDSPGDEGKKWADTETTPGALKIKMA